MKWLILSSFLVCWARFGVRCEQAALSEAQVEQPKVVQCLAGTEWETNCHQCRCLSFGVALCRKQEPCDTSPDAEPITCKPNTVFYRDCNSCLCLANGNVQCSTNTCQRSDTPKKSDLLPGKECSPGSKWTSQCNECTCSSEGHPTCTEKICPGQETERKLSCAPESAWKDECNRCWCSSDGYALCTKMGCSIITALDFNVDSEDKEIGELEPVYEVKYILNDNSHNLLKRSVCKSNSEFQMKCNPCKCAANGESFACTQNECMELDDNSDTDIIDKDVEVFMKSEDVDHIKRHSVCKPLAIFYIGCNTCSCNYDGSGFFCTNKPCPLPDDVEIFQSQDLKDVKPIVP